MSPYQRHYVLTPMSSDSVSKFSGAWSQPVDRLSGRLRIEFEDLAPGLRYAVYLDVKNHSVDALAVINQPEIHAELYDSSGNSVNTTGISGNGPGPGPQWVVVPRDASVALRVDMRARAIPLKEHKRVFLGLGGKTWNIGAGKYLLEAKAVFAPELTGPANQWTGELELPAVEIVVTDDMFN